MARLLLLDNDERIVELLSWFLRERGFEVDVAQSFAVARERIAAARPDLLVSDVDLGTETAVEELPRLSAEGILPPTLVVSGFLDEAVEGRLRAVPEVLDTLPKPFEFNDLEGRIQGCLESGAAIAGAAEREAWSRRPRAGGGPGASPTVSPTPRPPSRSSGPTKTTMAGWRSRPAEGALVRPGVGEGRDPARGPRSPEPLQPRKLRT